MDAFLGGTWATSWHHHRAGSVSVPMGLGDIDELLATGGLRPPAMRVMRAGQPVPSSAYTAATTVGSHRVTDWIHPGKAITLFEEGATLNFQGLQRLHPAMGTWCRGLEDVLGHPVQANGYLSPGGSQGLKVHHDTHDVFVVQVAGTKTFELFETKVQLPLKEHSWAADEAPGEPVATIELVPGDCLYLPRGVPHRAFTGAAPSLHLTVGVLAVTWHRVLQEAVRDALAADARFRRPLPVGYATNPEALAAEAKVLLAEAARLVADLDPAAVTASALDRPVTHRPPPLRGLLTELFDAGRAPTGDLVWRRRPEARASVREEGSDAVVDLEDRRLRLPGWTVPALARILESDRITAGDLADWLDPAGALVLLRALHREGLLRPEAPASPPTARAEP